MGRKAEEKKDVAEDAENELDRPEPSQSGPWNRAVQGDLTPKAAVAPARPFVSRKSPVDLFKAPKPK